MENKQTNKIAVTNPGGYRGSYNANNPDRWFSSIDGLRALSCIGIIAMHIKANTCYEIKGFLYGPFIDSLTWLVYLFLMISSFGMCAGYLDRFQQNSRSEAKDIISLETFYKKRYAKILPFFGFLLIIALLFEPSIASFYEASLEITLLHGLLPNNYLNVLGVCWTLGVIFLFYLLFPAFTVLMKNKKRAWASLAVSLWINYICQVYFFGEIFVTELFAPRHSFIYCMPMFISGGIVYLYRDMIRSICNKFRWGVLVVCMMATAVFYILPAMSADIKYYILLPIFMLWLAYAVGVESRFLGCRVMKYLSQISMEMYLAQMIVFRLIERCGLLYILGNGWVGFLVALMLTIIGLIVFIECYKVMERIIKRYFGKSRGDYQL